MERGHITSPVLAPCLPLQQDDCTAVPTLPHYVKTSEVVYLKNLARGLGRQKQSINPKEIPKWKMLPQPAGNLKPNQRGVPCSVLGTDAKQGTSINAMGVLTRAAGLQQLWREQPGVEVAAGEQEDSWLPESQLPPSPTCSPAAWGGPQTCSKGDSPWRERVVATLPPSRRVLGSGKKCNTKLRANHSPLNSKASSGTSEKIPSWDRVVSGSSTSLVFCTPFPAATPPVRTLPAPPNPSEPPPCQPQLPEYQPQPCPVAALPCGDACLSTGSQIPPPSH